MGNILAYEWNNKADYIINHLKKYVKVGMVSGLHRFHLLTENMANSISILLYVFKEREYKFWTSYTERWNSSLTDISVIL